MGKIIWIEGIIGIGKSTVAKDLVKETGWTYVPEPVEDNPYLYNFYRNMKRWAFPMQIDFLHKRFEQHLTAQNNDGVFIFDRGIAGDMVFADLQNSDGHISNIEFMTYRNAHRIMTNLLHTPDLIVYLDGNTDWAYDRVRKRAREEESEGLTHEYLDKLNTRYLKNFLRKPSNKLVKNVERVIWRDGMNIHTILDNGHTLLENVKSVVEW